jgi:hypothetical protein
MKLCPCLDEPDLPLGEVTLDHFACLNVHHTFVLAVVGVKMWRWMLIRSEVHPHNYTVEHRNRWHSSAHSILNGRPQTSRSRFERQEHESARLIRLAGGRRPAARSPDLLHQQPDEPYTASAGHLSKTRERHVNESSLLVEAPKCGDEPTQNGFPAAAQNSFRCRSRIVVVVSLARPESSPMVNSSESPNPSSLVASCHRLRGWLLPFSVASKVANSYVMSMEIA